LVNYSKLQIEDISVEEATTRMHFFFGQRKILKNMRNLILKTPQSYGRMI
jgi:hypothetical protein